MKQAVIALVGVVLVGALGIVVVSRLVPGELPGVTQPPNEGRNHLPAGEAMAYATAAPTSGPHSPGAPRCGVLGQQLPPELAIHALEHGSVAIWYQPTLGQDDIAGLRDIVDAFDDRVILSPNGQLDQPIVATAWNRFKAYDGADVEIEAFIETYRGRGPENVRCPY